MGKLTDKINILMADNTNLKFELDNMRANEKYQKDKNRQHAIFEDNNIHTNYNQLRLDLEQANQKIRELQFEKDGQNHSQYMKNRGAHGNQQSPDRDNKEFMSKISDLKMENDQLKRQLHNKSEIHRTPEKHDGHDNDQILKQALMDREFLEDKCIALQKTVETLKHELEIKNMRIIEMEKQNMLGLGHSNSGRSGRDRNGHNDLKNSNASRKSNRSRNHYDLDLVDEFDEL